MNKEQDITKHPHYIDDKFAKLMEERRAMAAKPQWMKLVNRKLCVREQNDVWIKAQMIHIYNLCLSSNVPRLDIALKAIVELKKMNDKYDEPYYSPPTKNLLGLCQDLRPLSIGRGERVYESIEHDQSNSSCDSKGYRQNKG